MPVQAPPSNEALMLAYLAGDSQAFSTLYRGLAPGVRAFFRGSFRDDALAQDLLQQTFMKAHKARATYQPPRPVKPWFFSIAGNVRIDEWRRRARKQEDLATDDEPVDGIADAPPADALIDGLRHRSDLQHALDALPEGQRVVVHLHYFEGLGFAEVAATLGISESAAKVRAFRAYERLRATLGPEAAS